MLKFFRVQRFKTLLDASFPLASLNLFTGLNGMGKSSMIQALLLLRQSHEANVLASRGMLLKGPYLNLGTGQDVLSAQAEVNSIEFLLRVGTPAGGLGQDAAPAPGDATLKFNFSYEQNSDLQPGGLCPGDAAALSEICLFNSQFQYLSADRIGPRSHYELSDFNLREMNSLGIRGEYAIQYIAESGAKPLPISNMKHRSSASLSFLDNLNAWMSELSPGIRIRALTQPQFNAVTLGYAFEQGKEITADFKPQNVGFGLTYVLPIVTALLRAKPGDLLLLENPESHLHPAGQSTVGKLCALAAANGVQMILESHSDHFLNGVRVAVKQGLVSADQVRLFYLERHREDVTHSSIVHSPALDADGRIDHWPAGFFDEWDKSLEQLL